MTATLSPRRRCVEYTGFGGTDFLTQDFVNLSGEELHVIFEDSYRNGKPRPRAAYDVMIDQAAFAMSGALERF